MAWTATFLLINVGARVFGATPPFDREDLSAFITGACLWQTFLYLWPRFSLSRQNKKLARDPHNIPALLARARAKNNLKDRNGALDDYTRVLELDPHNIKALFDRAEIHYHQKSYPEALADLNAILALQPNNARAYFHSGMAKRKQGHLADALADYSRARQFAGKNLPVWFLAALSRYALAKRVARQSEY